MLCFLQAMDRQQQRVISAVQGPDFCRKGFMWWFPEIGEPLVIIHF